MTTATRKVVEKFARPGAGIILLFGLLSGMAQAIVEPASIEYEPLPLAEGKPKLTESQIPAQLRARQMNEQELAGVTGQSLFISDVIQGTDLSATHGVNQSNTTFYRIGLDADLLFNINIDKLQMGCGGVNEGLVANACDLDVDFFSLTGPNGPDDDFLFERPYLELAVRNDGDRTRREIAGIKIGSAAASGDLSIGRNYALGQTNQEHGLQNGNTCGTSSGTQDNGSRLACSSGVNHISGFLLGEFSANGRIDDFGGGDVCMGWTSNTSDNCGQAQEIFGVFSGTRMDRIGLVGSNNELRTYNCGGLLSFLGCPDANFKLSQSLRTLHHVPLGTGTGVRRTRDFFLSFQRERIAYPIFDQASPYGTLGPPGGMGTSSGWTQSTFSAPANTGWWMNVTYADARGLEVGTLELGGLLDALDALIAGGALQDLNLGMQTIDNCYGAARFC